MKLFMGIGMVQVKKSKAGLKKIFYPPTKSSLFFIHLKKIKEHLEILQS